MQQILKKQTTRGFTQFELTTSLLKNLHKFNLTPVTKLVLLELTTHLNESKNGSVVFPSVGYIAEVLGIGLTAAKNAINDLIKEGLIIKSKRSKIQGNYNKYLITPKVQNLASEWSENEPFKKSDSDRLLIRTNNKEQINKQKIFNLKIPYVDPHRYETGELKRLNAINSEHIEKLPKEYFDNIRKQLFNTPSRSPQGEAG